MMEIAYYNSVEMPWVPYVKVSVTRDLRHLLISPIEGPISDELIEQLRGAWLNIGSQWTEIVDDADAKGYTENLHRINDLKARLLRLRMAVNACRRLPMPAFIEILRAEAVDSDWDMQFDPEDPEQFSADLDRVLVELTADEISLEMLEAKINKKKEANGDDEPEESITYAQFDALLFEINHSEGVTYHEKDLNVRQVAGLVKRMRQRQPKTIPQPTY